MGDKQREEEERNRETQRDPEREKREEGSSWRFGGARLGKPGPEAKPGGGSSTSLPVRSSSLSTCVYNYYYFYPLCIQQIIGTFSSSLPLDRQDLRAE